MPEMNLIEAVRRGLELEMERDERVVVLGEDVGRYGGVFRATLGLQERFGEQRVIDTPLSESGIIGTAIGMALYGQRPVPEIQFADFIYPAFDQIVSEAAKYRYRSGGEYTVPMTIRTPYGGGIGGGHYHSQSPEALFCQVPGLKMVVPSDPFTAKGLLAAAVRDPDPVLFLEPKRLYRSARGEVPDDEHLLPLGRARIARAGDACTLVAWGAMVEVGLGAAAMVEAQGAAVEVVDLLTLAPLDQETVLASVRKTGRLVVVQEAPSFCGYAAELAALAADAAVLSLEAPVRRVSGLDTPFPYTLEQAYLPSPRRLAKVLIETIRF